MTALTPPLARVIHSEEGTIQGVDELAAGGIVWRQGSPEPEVLLVHRPRYDDWSMPKGKLEPGECLLECARREVWEETGAITRIGRYLGSVNYLKPDSTRKEVHYWAMESDRLEFNPTAEVDQIRWVGLSSLAEEISYGSERGITERLVDDWNAPADRILLTRHAHAGRRRAGPTPDSARPLSEKGSAQAEGLIEQLEGLKVDTILTSYATRCLLTVMPVATQRKRVPESTAELWEEADEPTVRGLLDDLPAGTTLLCTHRPVVKMALRTLLDTTEDVYPRAKGSTWVFDIFQGQVASANYLAPRP